MKALIKEAKALKEKCEKIITSLKKTIDAIETLFKQPMDLQTLAGLPKALSAQIKALLGNMRYPGLRQ